VKLNGWVSALMSERLIGVFRECTNPECRFRYPDMRIEYLEDFCPKCGDPSAIRSQVISAEDGKSKDSVALNSGLVVLLDNIRSVYNVGSIFRTCEGLGVKEIYLTGISPTPKHTRLAKTGLGAEENIKWTHQNNASVLLNKLHKRGFFLLGLERTEGAIPIQEFNSLNTGLPICLIVGNERLGIDPEIQKICDALVCIPMQGIKESLNVSVAFAIAAFYLMELIRRA